MHAKEPEALISLRFLRALSKLDRTVDDDNTYHVA